MSGQRPYSRTSDRPARKQFWIEGIDRNAALGVLCQRERWNVSLEYLGEFPRDYTGNGVFGSVGFAF